MPSFARAWDGLRAFLAGLPEPRPESWTSAAAFGAGSLVCLWAGLFAFTWGRWGDLTVDCGREMYVPWELAQGRVLYRDLWYPYPPLAPHLNGLLFTLFGPRVEVLYWAGSLSALAIALLLFLTGMRLSSWLAGGIAGAVLLVQGFSPSLFSFPLPYSFASVYGLLASCGCMWFCVRASTDERRRWLLGAAGTAAVASLLKTEFGFGCYCALALLLVARASRTRSWRETGLDFLACLPGIAACAATGAWMVSLGGWEFLTQENLMSWPSSWFMKRYGSVWLEMTGLSLSGWTLPKALLAVLIVIPCYAFRAVYARYGTGWRVISVVLVFLVACGIAGVLFFPWAAGLGARLLFFPPSLVFLVALASAIALSLWRLHAAAGGFLGYTLLSVLAWTIGVRCLFGAAPKGYSIYYTSPAVLAFLLALRSAIVPGWVQGRARRGAEALPCLALLGAVLISLVEPYRLGRQLAAFPTERGLFYLPADKVVPYRTAIEFMRGKGRAGETTLSVPEDASLYFLSGTHCPTRVYAFVPGVVAPGPMTDQLLAELERKPVHYLIWSNRRFPEYGVPRFGVDFDQALGDYLRSRFRPVASLPASKSAEWQATVWKRIR